MKLKQIVHFTAFVVSGRMVEEIAPVKWTEHFTEAELEQIKSKV
jgi:hypothetical protein